MRVREGMEGVKTGRGSIKPDDRQRSHVPAFGNWESEGNVPYTVFFDKARKGRGGGPIRNPNDPEEYPDILIDNSHEAPPSKPSLKDDTPPPKPTTHERRHSREDGGFRPYANSPGNRENPGRRQSGSDYSIDRSPLHRQAKPSARDSSMTEGKSFEGSYDNRGKTKTKNNSPPEGTAVPKFGSWDVNNPASADGFTHIFGKVREERLGPGTPPPQHSSSPYNNANNRRPDDSVKGQGLSPRK
ncbi:RPM1-interacting protein 4 [Cucumis melo var. makuwa]|uniref:RPM1-interacting protein 4 n=1 Tax=Cucumis melo var. makuwa TaxID=1194695 RepID=A0A5A7SK62_CUCMM|nr:RPM1-interacting protein 4 [Cucumis melo var. makuwa]TYK30762.1 RPM1-interacting protein 4 [Cucumis melo var. makuwa]